MNQNGDQNELQNGAKWRHLALLGLTLVILKGPEKCCFLSDFRSAKSADNNRWMLALGRPGGPKSPPALRQGVGKESASIVVLGTWLPKAGLARARNR